MVTVHRVAMDTSLCLDDHFPTPPTLRDQLPTLSVGDEFKSYFSYLIIAQLMEHFIGTDYNVRVQILAISEIFRSSPAVAYVALYNNPSYSRILIGDRL